MYPDRMILEVDQRTLNHGGMMSGKFLPDMTDAELGKYVAAHKEFEESLGFSASQPRFFRLEQITL